jgi:hypothetical protein
MRLGVPLVAALAALAATAAVTAAPTPTYTVAFQGNGTEHQVDLKLNIEDTGECEAAEHVDVTAAVTWSASWSGFRPGARSGRSTAAAISGSRFTGTHVKDACEADEEAPPGWESEASCDIALAMSARPQLSSATRGQRLVLTLTAPAFAVPIGTQCPLNVRNDQFVAHAGVKLAQLRALKRGAGITVRLGTSSPGPGDLYATDRDCSAPTKPYDGYRTEDHCQDQLSWSGTVKITRSA